MVWSLQKLSHQECGGHRARPRPPGAEDVGATVGSAGGGQGLGPGERPLEEGRGEPETLFPRQPAAGTEPACPAQFACHHFQAARQGFLPPPSSPALLPLREASPRPPSPPVLYCLGTSRCRSPPQGRARVLSRHWPWALQGVVWGPSERGTVVQGTMESSWLMRTWGHLSCRPRPVRLCPRSWSMLVLGTASPQGRPGPGADCAGAGGQQALASA